MFQNQSLGRCEECGVSVAEAYMPQHECDEVRRKAFQNELVEKQMRQMKKGIENFSTDFETWLRTPQGMFAQIYARRSR